MTIKIVFFGNSQAGKTTLIKRLFHPEVLNYFIPEPTSGFATERVLAQDVFMEIWDLSGEQRYWASRPLHYLDADIAIYCVDLSIDIDHNLIANDIQNFREANREAKLILVGTKAALVQQVDKKFKSINDINFHDRYIPTTELELADFLEKLGILAKQTLASKIRAINQYELENLQVNLFEQAKKYLRKGAPIDDAVDSFMESVHHLPKEKYLALSKEVFLLIDSCCYENKEEIPNYIEIFVNHCNIILEKNTPYLKNSILALAAAVFMTFVVGALGFGIGFAAGIWGGPLAFFTAIATSYAAITVVAFAGSSGLAAGVLTAYGLFNEKKPEMELLDDIAKAALLIELA